jgi:hypothetical protein
MKVRIVCYEDVNLWILGKFALRLRDNLETLGVDVDIANTPDPSADVNHHIIYICYDGKPTNVDTVMITHIDTESKCDLVRRQLDGGAVGICMSSDTAAKLTRNGVRRDRLCYVNPGHDYAVKPRKLVIGITSKVQPTGCKREHMLTEIAGQISRDDFAFTIMGSGWDEIVNEMVGKGIAVDYCDHFDRERYHELIPSLDYYLYFGQDEGSMGFVDALAAGIPTIVTPQGFHLDAKDGISYPFNHTSELVRIFNRIVAQRRRLTGSVSEWSWPEYARRHLSIWEYLLRCRSSAAVPSELWNAVKLQGVARRSPVTAAQTAFYRAASGTVRNVSTFGKRLHRFAAHRLTQM